LAACRQVYDSCHLQADYREPGSASEPYARQLATFTISNVTSERTGPIFTEFSELVDIE